MENYFSLRIETEERVITLTLVESNVDQLVMTLVVLIYVEDRRRSY